MCDESLERANDCSSVINLKNEPPDGLGPSNNHEIYEHRIAFFSGKQMRNEFLFEILSSRR